MATYDEFDERIKELKSRLNQLFEDTFDLIEDIINRTEEIEFTDIFFDTI